MAEKMQPHNIETEQALLGILLYKPHLFTTVAPLVDGQDFWREAHQVIFTQMHYLQDANLSMDITAITERVERAGVKMIDDRETSFYLEQVEMNEYGRFTFEPMEKRAITYATAIAEMAEARRVLEVIVRALPTVYSGESGALERIESMLAAIRRHKKQQEFVSIGAYMHPYLDRLADLQKKDSKMRGISTGYPDLDYMTGGLHRGSLYIPAARPGVGKTTLIQNFAYNIALKQQKRIAFFSLEMSLNDLMDRFAALDSKINSQHLRNGDLTDSEMERLVGQTLLSFQDMGIYFAYTPGITIDALKSVARHMVAKHDIDVLMVDFLQLLKAEIGGKRITPRAEEVAETARQLKELAGELNVVIVAPAQINREIEHRTPSKVEGEHLTFKMPMLSDLRESGELEQSADVVMFLARSEEKEQRVKLIVAKHRSGPTGEIDLYFKGEETRFYPVQEVYA